LAEDDPRPSLFESKHGVRTAVRSTGAQVRSSSCPLRRMEMVDSHGSSVAAYGMISKGWEKRTSTDRASDQVFHIASGSPFFFAHFFSFFWALAGACSLNNEPGPGITLTHTPLGDQGDTAAACGHWWIQNRRLFGHICINEWPILARLSSLVTCCMMCLE
jgi:hypothetical protein